MLNFHVEIKHPDPNMPCPEWSCEICKKSYPHSRALQAHIKLVHNAKPIHFCILCEKMYKTKDTLARHTISEEYSKVETKLALKMYL